MEEDWFFDSRDEVSSVSDLSSNCSEGLLSYEDGHCALGYEFWTKKPDSIDERRGAFLKWMGLSSDWHRTYGDEEQDSWHQEIKRDDDSLRDSGEKELAKLDGKLQFFPSHSFQSFQSYEATDSDDGDVDKNLTWRIKNLDNGIEFALDKLADDGIPPTFREVGSNRMLSFDEFQKTLGSSMIVQRLLRKDGKECHVVDTENKVKSSWLRKFSAMANIADRAKRAFAKPYEISSNAGSATRSVHVDMCNKHSKELSSLYTGQEFSAHVGSILTMKFSLDGQYLASAGEDGIVRVWKVLDDDFIKNFDIQDADPSCSYFSLNHFSKLAPMDVPKEKTSKTRNLKKSSHSACVIIPEKVFQLLEKPLHEFHGHEGEVLALSWSKNGHLLSSSVDKTARLWRLGNDHCLGVFSHNNYVTCVEFNPVDDNYFISGSIDGKIRIWEVQGRRVIDWTDIREIITAVCYSPDGKGGVVGSMDGNCRFYDVIDDRLQVGAQVCLKGKKKLTLQVGAKVCLKGKKKLTDNRITGVQFCPSDASKIMVTTADSQVRILSGTNVVGKFKGNRSSGIQVPASFTSDGEHIVSTTEDSNVHIYSYNTHDQKSNRPKNLWSRESFLSRNASIAIPWCGLKNKLGALGFFLDCLYRGTATWPEEKLLESRPMTVLPSICKSEFKFLKNAWLGALNSPHLWGLVIVTAGWDGCIRTFLNYGLPIRF